MKRQQSISSPTHYKNKSIIAKKKKGKDLTQLASKLPVYYVALILLSIIQEVIYFGLFGINITNYFTISDFVILIIDDAFLIIGITIFLIVGLRKLIPLVDIYHRIAKGSGLLHLIVVLSYAALLMTFMAISSSYLDFYSAMKLLSLSHLILLTTITVYSSIEFEYDQLTVFILLVFIIFCYGLFMGFQKKETVKYTDSKLARIGFQDGTAFEGTENTHIIGSSSNYYFIFDRKDSVKYTINRNTIKTLEYDLKRKDNSRFIYYINNDDSKSK